MYANKVGTIYKSEGKYTESYIITFTIIIPTLFAYFLCHPYIFLHYVFIC